VSRLIVHAIPASLLAYAVVALAGGRWLSGLAAPVVAWLLWRRHARARFSVYVLLTVIGVRALVAGPWWLAAFATAAILLLQAPAARRAWPRLRPGFARRAGDRMSRP
jgi:hypothetical protein